MRRAIKLILNAGVFTTINHVAIAAGFLTYHYSGSPNQLLVQVPLAVALSVGGVLVWLLHCGRWHRLELEQDAILVFLLVLPVGAVLLVPVHYAFTGYLTSFGNILGGWIFAFMANVPALALAAAIWRRREAEGS